VTTKDELTAKEAEAWAGFEELLASVPEERLETPAFDGGWSVKDVLWHVAYWWDDMTRAAQNAWADDGEETDDVNGREQAKSRVLPYVEVRAELDDARARLLEIWASVGADDEEGKAFFVSETIEHYEEHVPQLRSLVEDPNVKARGA
jgi:DinB superfamily